jgi:hypothetical protein
MRLYRVSVLAMTTPFKNKMGTKGGYITLPNGKRVFVKNINSPAIKKMQFQQDSLKTMGNAVDKTAKFFKDLFK